MERRNLRSKNGLEIRDVIHGSIHIEKSELPVVDSRHFQRLRYIKQLGFAEFSFPSATHNRYIHSLGAMEVASRAFDSIFAKLDLASSSKSLDRFRTVLRLAALLHDIGHGPLSHTSEFAMPKWEALQIPTPSVSASQKSRKATHEDYTLKIILNSSLTPLIAHSGAAFGFTPAHVASLIDPATLIEDDFFQEQIEGEKIDFRPLLCQLISSELDSDRMDYLRRDSLHAGVSYGQFDLDWILINLTAHLADGSAKLALEHRALYAFEDFLISRFHMFLMVYFHYKSVVFDEMLAQYLSHPECAYRLPTDVEEYIQFNDAHLYAHLSESPNEWARRITDKRPYRMLIELHSGIPATKIALTEQKKILQELEESLCAKRIHYLLATSTGELSKYFGVTSALGTSPLTWGTAPIYVRYDNHYSHPSFIALHECTDLFRRYSEKRSITRLYVSPENYQQCREYGMRGHLCPS